MTNIDFENKHPRQDGGKFAAKEGTQPAVSLGAGSQHDIQEDIKDILAGLDGGYMKTEDGQRLIGYANDPNIDEETDALLTEAADAAEDWNFHYTSLRISAGQGIRAWRADPDAPLTHTGSIAYDEKAPEELLERIYKEEGFQHGFPSNPAAPPAALMEAVENYPYFDEKLVSNPHTPTEALDIIAKRMHNGRWNEELRKHPNLSERLSRRIEKEEELYARFVGEGPL